MCGEGFGEVPLPGKSHSKNIEQEELKERWECLYRGGGRKKRDREIKKFQKPKEAQSNAEDWNLEPETASQEGTDMSEQLGGTGCGGVGNRARRIFGTAVL